MQIDYYIKNRYGNEDMYIVNAVTATAVTMLTGRKTITITDKQALETLGLTFKQVVAPQ